MIFYHDALKKFKVLNEISDLPSNRNWYKDSLRRMFWKAFINVVGLGKAKKFSAIIQ